jgi:hypothetical protein
MIDAESLTALFKQRHGRLVFGGFGLTKLKEVEQALDDNACVWTKDDQSRPTSVAIARVSLSAGHFTDFAGTDFMIPSDETRVTEFACTEPVAGARVLSALRARRPDHGLWVEIFEEDDTAKAAVAAVSELRYVTTKVMGSSELKGIYTTRPPYMPPMHPADEVSLAVLQYGYATENECSRLAAEADLYGEWADHYSVNNKGHSWSAVALRGYDKDDPQFIAKPTEMSKAWRKENPHLLSATCDWTEVAQRCPKTMLMVERILRSQPVDRVRFMRLTPAGELTRHADIADRDAGIADGKLARIHLPLRTSPHVTFHGWSKRGETRSIHFPLGALCYLDQRGPHRVENKNPNADRIHLVIDMHSDNTLRTMIAQAPEKV